MTLFDTASNYGAGHSERILGRALAGRRDSAVIATKFGNVSDEATRRSLGTDASPAFAVRSLEDSLRRLGTDHVDLYQLHLNELPVPAALDLVDTLEDLVDQGKIRAYGWSTDDPASAEAFAAAGAHCAAIQHDESVLRDNAAVLAVCDSHDLASLNRGPLAMGLLTGSTRGASARTTCAVGRPSGWSGSPTAGRRRSWAARVEQVRAALTADGRTLAQGALGWLLARSPRTVPIPGLRTVAQAEENLATLTLGPLPAESVRRGGAPARRPAPGLTRSLFSPTGLAPRRRTVAGKTTKVQSAGSGAGHVRG